MAYSGMWGPCQYMYLCRWRAPGRRWWACRPLSWRQRHEAISIYTCVDDVPLVREGEHVYRVVDVHVTWLQCPHVLTLLKVIIHDIYHSHPNFCHFLYVLTRLIITLTGYLLNELIWPWQSIHFHHHLPDLDRMYTFWLNRIYVDWTYPNHENISFCQF